MNCFQPVIKDFTHILYGGDYNPDQWLHAPDVINHDFKLMNLAHCNTFSVGIFSWTSYERTEGVFSFDWLDRIMDRMADDNKKVFLATPSGAKPAWMALKYPEICRVDKNGVREHFQGRHNHCFSSPVYREKVNLINSKLAERYASHPALAGWHVSNEYRGTGCWCPLCQAKFREFLQTRYQTLDALNSAWWGPFWNHIYTSWNEIFPFDLSDAMQIDWMRFLTDNCFDFMRSEIAPLKRFSPDKPITTNMMGFYHEINYWKIAELCDFIADDCYPEWNNQARFPRIAAEFSIKHDMHRSMKNGKPFVMLESAPSATNWACYHKLKRPGIHKAEMLNALAHGADGVMYFQWRKSQGNLEKFHGAVVDHAGSENTRVFHEVAEVGSLCSKLDSLVGTVTPAQVALVYDWESLWNIDLSGGPTQHNKKYLITATDHYKAFWNLSIPVDVIDSQRDFSKYKLLVIPMLFMFPEGYAEKVARFVEQGGTVVMSYLSAYVNESGKCYLDGWPGDGMRKVFGIWNEELDGFDPDSVQSICIRHENGIMPDHNQNYRVLEMAERIHSEGAQVIGTYGNDFYAGEPAVTQNSYGAGNAFYIAARTGEDFLTDFYAAISARKGIKKILGEKRYPDGVHATIRTDFENREFLFLFNMGGNPVTIELPDGNFLNVENGASCSGALPLNKLESCVLKRL